MFEKKGNFSNIFSASVVLTQTTVPHRLTDQSKEKYYSDRQTYDFTKIDNDGKNQQQE